MKEMKETGKKKKKLYKNLYFQVIVGILIGILLGIFNPDLAVQMKPLGDGFIKLIKMLIAPIIFATVVVGIANMGDLKKVGRVGLKAIIYFEVLTTIALVIGMIVVKIYQPGAGLNADPNTLDTKAIESYTTAAEHLSFTDFVLNIIPNNVVDAFAKGEILQVLLFSILLGVALSAMGEKAKPFVKLIDTFSQAMFGIVGMIMHLAPIGAFGAMSFTIGKYGVKTLGNLMKLMAGVYTTSILFVFVILGLVAWMNRFSIWKFLVYIKEEILLVLGTSSSESALPRMMDKLEKLGVSKPVVGLTIPMGYSFNLDGTSIYLTMAALFIAQATNTPLTFGEELTILAVLMLTSKGAAAVTGGGFITLAATLSSIHTLPIAALTLLLGVDRFMSEARAITNLIGNGVASVVIARWEKEFDEERAKKVLNGEIQVDGEEMEFADSKNTALTSAH